MENLPIDYSSTLLCQLFRKEPLTMEAAYFWLLQQCHGYRDLELQGNLVDEIELNKDFFLEIKQELTQFDSDTRLDILGNLLKCATNKRAENAMLQAAMESLKPKSAIRLAKIEGYKGLYKTGWMAVAEDYTALLQAVTGDDFFRALNQLPWHFRAYLKTRHGHAVATHRIYSEDLELYTALWSKFEEQTAGKTPEQIQVIVQNIQLPTTTQHTQPTGQSHGKEC